MNIKRFWVRKILGRIYDEDEIFNHSISISKMNKAELGLAIDMLYMNVLDNQQDIKTAISIMAESPNKCDKCLNYDGEYKLCFKCEGTGIVKNGQLCNWPWSDME